MRKGSSGRLIFGLLFIIIGAGYLLNIAGFLNFNYLFGHWWPLLIVLFALLEFAFNRRKSAMLWGILGLVLLLSTTGVIKTGFWSIFWPLVLIVIGLDIIISVTHFGISEENDFVNAFSIFGASEKKAESKNFRGASLISIFGGSKVDLRNAKIAEKGATVDVLVLFGGSEIVVSKDTKVKLDTFALFGGSDDKRSDKIEDGENKPTIRVQGIVLFGGVEVKD